MFLKISKGYISVVLIALLIVGSLAMTVNTYNEIKAAPTVLSKTSAETKPSFALVPVSLQKSVIKSVEDDIKLASLSRPETTIDNEVSKQPILKAVDLTVNNGDTLAQILKRGGVKANVAQQAITAMGKLFDPRKLRRGQTITVRFRLIDTPAAKKFTGFSITPDYTQEIRVDQDASGKFNSNVVAKQFDTKLVASKAQINSSLYLSAKKADIPVNVIVELIRAFSWDVDFQRDIRKNDQLQVLYQQTYNDKGVLQKSGDIAFAALTLSGKQRNIYRYTNTNNQTRYFDETGASAQKALMRTPIDGARLSSRFGKRKHPVLGYTKMHKGVDFAAPRGTPIYAAGDGVVVYAGKKGGFGNYVRIRHNQEFNTAYAHMRNIARKIRKGTRVSQGQVIGYAGSSGRSTGSHLHYEILKKGRQTNPLRVKMPSGKKLTGKELARFLEIRQQIDNQYTKANGDETIINASR